ncbi:MAG: autotransporter assembly complex family protein [Gammaproteobacteria bacterium]
MSRGPARMPAGTSAWCALVGLAVAAQARATVELKGVDGEVAANVLAFLTLDEEPCDAESSRVDQQRSAAPARIRQALEAFGYYEPKIESQLDRVGDCWHVIFTIAAGEPVRIRELDVQLAGEAATDSEFVAARTAAAFETGSALHHGAYETLKTRWADLARERGYRDAKFVENHIDVYPDQHAADVVLRFDSGSRYTFGAVDFRQDVLLDPLVRSYLPFHSGEPYDARKLTELYVALADSGFFRNIDVRSLEPNRDDRTIPIEIALTPGARLQISYGVGFSTDTGPRFRFTRNNRRFNENGHQFGVAAQLSPVTSEVTANYRFPIARSRAEWLNLDTGVKREETDTSTSKSFEFGVRRVRERVNDWTRTQMLMLQVENFVVADERGRSNLLMPGIDWTRLRADNPLRPHAGSKLQLDVRGATDAVFSDTTFVQVSAEGKWIWSLSRGARILVRGHVGATAKNSLAELPPSVRFFAGGDSSVRGYDFKSLGPVDAAGKVIGGSALAEGSFEFEQPLTGRWSFACFVDAGNAFEGSHIDAKSAAGLGGRWQSPLGPIRIDLAHPFDDPATRWRIHISLGPDL